MIQATSGGLLSNRAIKKEIANYGGLSMYVSIVKVLEECTGATSGLLN